MLSKRMVEVLVLFLCCLTAYMVGKNVSKRLKRDRTEKNYTAWINRVNIFCLVGVVAGQYLGISIISWIFLGVSGFSFGVLDEESAKKLSKVGRVRMICSLIAAYVMVVILLLQYVTIFSIIKAEPIAIRFQNIWLIVLIWCMFIQFAGIFCKNSALNGSIQRYSLGVSNAIIWGNLLVLLFGWLINGYGLKKKEGVFQRYISFVTEPVHVLNILLVLSIFIALICLIGYRAGCLISVFLLAVIFVANMIKIKYHSTFFSWFDLLQIKEMLLMGKEFIGERVWIWIEFVLVLVVVFGIFLVKKHWRKILKSMHFKCRPALFLISAGIVVMMVNWLQGLNDQSELGIYSRTWENKAVNVSFNGLMVNLVLDLDDFQSAKMEKPVSYNQQQAESFLNEFSSISTTENEEVNPDVIVVMAESLFDMSSVPGIETDVSINSTLSQYNTMGLISPRYGGYTSAIEFEALTGMSLAFLPDSLTPYTTYFNNGNDKFPNIVENFKQNGYYTQVIHPDLAEFSNRDIVYESFGFDEYQSIKMFKDVPEDMMTENGWVKNEYLVEHIIEELEGIEEPQFLFAITMEEHYVTLDKYSDTEVHIVNENLAEDTKHELEQQAQSYYNTDKMIARLIEYVDSTDTPTLLYVFGDHLPPISYLGESGYVYEKDNKYGTTYIQYSNYKDLPVVSEKITPNQIAASIVNHAGIAHYSYFDYIYSLQKAYPVLHKEYVDVQNEEFDLYKYIQYDIMFGERYLATLER